MIASRLFWIDDPWPYTGRLAIAARPRGGDWLQDELASWRDVLGAGGVVVSLLTAEEVQHFAHFHASTAEINTDLDQYTSVSLADLRRVAKKYLRPDNSSTIVVVPGRGGNGGDQ